MLAATTTLCPSCLRALPGAYVERNGAVYLERTCPDHGATSALVLSNVAHFVAPDARTHAPLPTSTVVEAHARGDVAHKSCIALLEITDACNLSCAACYAQSPSGAHVPFDVVIERLARFIEERGELDVLQISGGEPTIHPDFLRILDVAKKLPIGHVMVNTNGLRLADDAAFARDMAKRKPRLEIYLQMDGLDRATHVVLRGRDLLEHKRRALQALMDAEIPTTLVCTAVDGVNVDELGAVLRLGLGLPYVRGVSFQPATHAGRFDLPSSHTTRATLSDVIAALDAQTGGDVAASDFRPLPCSHPMCCSFTFLARNDGKAIPLPRVVDVDVHLDKLADRIAFTADDAACCGVPAENLDGASLFRVVVKPFMDAHTYDQQRIDECCVHIIGDDGRGVSFCAHNVLRRGRAPDLVAIGKARA